MLDCDGLYLDEQGVEKDPYKIFAGQGRIWCGCAYGMTLVGPPTQMSVMSPSLSEGQSRRDESPTRLSLF